MPRFMDAPTGDNKEKVIKLKTIIKAGLDYRRQFEDDWRTNILFLRGKQWERSEQSPTGSSRVPITAPQSKVKLTNNKIYPLVRQAAASLVDNISQPIATPATMEAADAYAAEISTDFLVFRQVEDKEQEKRVLETIWLMCTGMVLRYTAFDPDAESTLLTGRVLGAGDIVTKMLNPWQFCLSPFAETANSSDWICTSQVMPIDEINEIYNSEVQAEQCAADYGLKEREMMGLIEDKHGTGQFQKAKNAAILHQIYARPSIKHPKGQYWTLANDVLLAESTLPEDEMPFVAQCWFPAPGTPYGISLVSPLIDPQKEINIALSQLISLKNKQLRGDMVVRGTGVPTEEVHGVNEFTNTESGRKTIYLDQNIVDWKFMDYNLDVSTAEWLMAELHNATMQLAGIHEATMGQRQDAGTPATTTLALKESDLSGLTFFRHGANYCHSLIGRQKIIIAKNHYKLPRINRIVGDGNEVKVAAFVGSDLRNTEDVRPNTTPMLTETEKNNIKAALIGQMAFGPYNGPKDQLAKIRMIQASGLPDAEQMAEKACAPMSVEDLEQIVGKLSAGEAQLALAQVEQAVQMATAPPQQEQNPMDEMPPDVQMVLQAGQMQQMQGQKQGAAA